MAHLESKVQEIEKIPNYLDRINKIVTLSMDLARNNEFQDAESIISMAYTAITNEMLCYLPLPVVLSGQNMSTAVCTIYANNSNCMIPSDNDLKNASTFYKEKLKRVQINRKLNYITSSDLVH